MRGGRSFFRGRVPFEIFKGNNVMMVRRKKYITRIVMSMCDNGMAMMIVKIMALRIVMIMMMVVVMSVLVRVSMRARTHTCVCIRL